MMGKRRDADEWQPRPGLSESELDVLKYLWRHGQSTVRQVNDGLKRAGRHWAYTTVLTLLQRLQAKGWVDSDTSSTAHVFRAAATREQWLQERMRILAAQACGGESMPLVLALVKGARFRPEELEEFRGLIEQLLLEEGGPRSE